MTLDFPRLTPALDRTFRAWLWQIFQGRHLRAAGRYSSQSKGLPPKLVPEAGHGFSVDEDRRSVLQWLGLPQTMTVRVLRVRVSLPGIRVREITLMTTLLDAELYPAKAIAQGLQAALASGDVF